MNFTHYLSLAAFTFSTLGISALAHAQEADATQTKAPRSAPPSDIALHSYGGSFLGSGNDQGYFAGADIKYRANLLEVGAFGELGATTFGYDYKGFGGTLGLGYRTPFNLRLSLAGALGAHFYEHVGGALLSDDPGASAALAFAGGRASASYLFLKGRTHIEVGVTASVDDDLTRPKVTETYLSTSWWTGKPTTGTATHEVGTLRGGLTLNVGVAFDLGGKDKPAMAKASSRGEGVE
jgi:hypothetical protein